MPEHRGHLVLGTRACETIELSDSRSGELLAEVDVLGPAGRISIRAPHWVRIIRKDRQPYPASQVKEAEHGAAA
jgi:hypothetical protein